MMTAATGAVSRRWALTGVWIGYWLFIFALTHTPLRGFRLPAEGGDKVIHFLAYFVLAILGGRAAIHRGVVLNGKWCILWGLVYAAYAALDELLQQFVGRTPSWRDWFADLAGAMLGLAILFAVRPQPDNPDDFAKP